MEVSFVQALLASLRESAARQGRSDSTPNMPARWSTAMIGFPGMEQLVVYRVISSKDVM